LAAIVRCGNLVRDDLILLSEPMGQLGFFDADRRLAALSERGDPLEAIASLVRGRVSAAISRRWWWLRVNRRRTWAPA